MAVNPIPEGYHTVTPYLVVTDVDQLLDFLKAAFDATEKERIPSKDGATGHAEVTIGDSCVMMGRAQDEIPVLPGMLYLYVPNTDATYEQALAAGATSLQEPTDMFYGDRNASVKDPAGNLWTIATRQENLTPEELAERAKEHMR
ncbi:MAG: VOC family protein [Acidobacteriota bacterium]|nr:VOC family protein [Acidobacteriota bacterium]